MNVARRQVVLQLCDKNKILVLSSVSLPLYWRIVGLGVLFCCLFYCLLEGLQANHVRPCARSPFSDGA